MPHMPHMPHSQSLMEFLATLVVGLLLFGPLGPYAVYEVLFPPPPSYHSEVSLHLFWSLVIPECLAFCGSFWGWKWVRRIDAKAAKDRFLILCYGWMFVVGICCGSIFLLFSILAIMGVRFGITQNDLLWNLLLGAMSLLVLPAIRFAKIHKSFGEGGRAR